MNTIFAILLLILIILALVIAFFAYQKNQRKYAVPKSAPKQNRSLGTETLEPNRPNYEVIRQPEPNVAISSKSNETDTKSVRSERI